VINRLRRWRVLLLAGESPGGRPDQLGECHSPGTSAPHSHPLWATSRLSRHRLRFPRQAPVPVFAVDLTPSVPAPSQSLEWWRSGRENQMRGIAHGGSLLVLADP
jgi:hypothetical protein